MIGLDIDLTPIADWLGLPLRQFIIWLATLGGTLAFGLGMAAWHQFARSPVERLLRRRGRA